MNAKDSAATRGHAAAARAPPRAWGATLGTIACILAGTAFLAWSAGPLEIRPGELVRSLPVIGGYLAKMYPPHWQALNGLWGPTLDTICVAIWGTVIGTIIGLPLGALGARNLNRSSLSRNAALALLNILRSISELIWAVFFVAAVGLGPFPGALALGVNFAGILGRLYAEAIENIEPGPLEALRATGAGPVQVILFAVMPQVLPQIVSYNLYWFEVGIRSATVLGMIGAGGIGFELVTSIRLYEFGDTAAILLTILALVTVIDQVSHLIRARIVK